MATQTQGKGKKKGKEVTKLSLDEFNQIDAPHGHSVVSLKVTGLDWAETMADYDQHSTETQQIIVPAAPRAQRGPGVDIESLPNEPPFRVSLFNLPMSVEEKDIKERVFQNLEVIRVEISKAETTVELGSKNDLYEALCKDGSSVRNRTINVCLYGQRPQNDYGSDRYGGRGGNSYGDRYGDRREGGGFGQRSGYGDRSGGFNRDRDNSYGGGFGRGGFGQREQGGGFGDRYNDRSNFREARGQYTSGGGEPESEEPTNWRSRPAVRPSNPSPTPFNGSRQPYTHSRSEPSQYQQPAPSHQYQQPEPYQQSRYQSHNNQPPNHSHYSQFNNQDSSFNRPLTSSSGEERPKLVINKRTKPVNVDDVSSGTRNKAIFGDAEPSSTPYEKMREVEEKLGPVHTTDKREGRAPSQTGSQTGSAPRSRRVSSNHSESNN